MKKYEFKYMRFELWFVLFFLGFFAVMRITDINSVWHSLWSQVGGDNAYTTASIILYIIVFFGTMTIAANGKGYGILHKKHVEIKLGRKTHEVHYSKIINVNESFNTSGFYWLIKVNEGRNIMMRRSLSLKRNKVMEQFMNDLKERSKV